MRILNYTTRIPADKTIQEIYSILAKAGADAIQTEYKERLVSAIAFRLNTPQGIIYYKLPANVRGVKASMIADKIKYANLDSQAYRVTWRILKDWIEAQMAIIQAGMAELSQVFLPYAQTSTGQTVYERFKNGGPTTLGITCDDGRSQ